MLSPIGFSFNDLIFDGGLHFFCSPAGGSIRFAAGGLDRDEISFTPGGGLTRDNFLINPFGKMEQPMWISFSTKRKRPTATSR